LKKTHSNLLATQIGSALKWRFWPLLQPLGNVGQSSHTGMLHFQSCPGWWAVAWEWSHSKQWTKKDLRMSPSCAHT